VHIYPGIKAETIPVALCRAMFRHNGRLRIDDRRPPYRHVCVARDRFRLACRAVMTFTSRPLCIENKLTRRCTCLRLFPVLFSARFFIPFLEITVGTLVRCIYAPACAFGADKAMR
jgi:hypothetical protein